MRSNEASGAGMRWVVAKWEFLRYFKWKEELIGIAVMIAIGAAMLIGSAGFEWSKASQRYSVAVLDRVGVDLLEKERSQITIERIAERDLPWKTEQVGLGQLDALVEILSLDEATVLLHKEPAFKNELQALLDDARRRAALKSAGIEDTAFEKWTQPMTMSLSYHEKGEAPASRGERLIVIGFLILLMSAVFTCFAYFFTSITSEKQARVTEQIISAIPMQTWIDGKLIGISLLGLKSMLTLTLWAGLVAFGVATFAPELYAKLGSIDADKVVVGILFILLGLAFWNSFLAGIAATIDDPNNSTRSSLMLVPSIPSFLAFPMLSHPDNLAVVIMSWLPLTSMAVMPVRYALTEVAWWEVAASALLLAWCVHMMRLYASRIFRAGMFLYGKEPSWRDMWRIVRSGEFDGR